jgi:hypothetical protein
MAQESLLPSVGLSRFKLLANNSADGHAGAA